MNTNAQPVSGEIWFKARRAVRTAAQVLVTGAGFLTVVALVAPQILDALADVLPGPVFAWLSAAVASVAALSAALARVMAIPAVDRWLKKIALGSAPRSAPVAPPAPPTPLPSTAAAVNAAARTREGGTPDELAP